MKTNILALLMAIFLLVLLVGVTFISHFSKETKVINIDTKLKGNRQAVNDLPKNNPIILKVAHNFPISHPQHMALVEKFVPMVEKGSGWNIRVEVYPNSQLVEEKQYIQGVRQGTIEMGIVNQNLTEILPRAKVLQFPYMFNSYDEAKFLLNGELGAKITKGIESLGVHDLAWSLNGFAQVFLNNNESDTVRLATISTQTGEEILKSMGFDAVSVELGDMSMTLRRKLVGGHDSPPLLSYYNGWYEENESKIILTNHVIHPSMYLVSCKFWNTLSKDYKDLVEKAAKESANYGIELLKIQEQDVYNTLKEQGITVESPDLLPYKSSVSSLYDKWLKEDNELKDIFEELKNKVK